MKKGTPQRMVRIKDDIWEDYAKLCAEEGTTRSDDMRQFVNRRINRTVRKV